MAVYQHISGYFRRSRIQDRGSSYPKHQVALPTVAVAECTCPDSCEHDHDNE